MSVIDSLNVARQWTPESGVELNLTDRIRNLLFAGEALTAEEVAERFECHIGTLSGVLKKLRDLGYEFSENPEPQEGSGRAKKRYTMLNPAHEPTQEQVEAMREKGRKADQAKKKAPAKKKAVEAEPVEVGPPVFGAKVEIYHLLDTDGGVLVGFRDEHTSWTATLLGGAPRKG